MNSCESDYRHHSGKISDGDSGIYISEAAARRRNRLLGLVRPALPLIAETLAREAFSAVAIESQHGLWDVAGIIAGISAVRLGGAAPIVRVPLNDFAMVSRALDFGAEGIIAPMINTPADATAFANAAKFPPDG